MIYMKKQFLIRIDSKELNRIKRAAKKDGYSANTFIVSAARYIIKEFYNDRK
jgi:predicted HicB family RNase H-like nuclease